MKKGYVIAWKLWNADNLRFEKKIVFRTIKEAEKKLRKDVKELPTYIIHLIIPIYYT